MNPIVALCAFGIVAFNAIWFWRWRRVPDSLKRSDHLFYLGQNFTLATLILIVVGPGQWIIAKLAAVAIALGTCTAYLIASAIDRAKARAK